MHHIFFSSSYHLHSLSIRLVSWINREFCWFDCFWYDQTSPTGGTLLIWIFFSLFFLLRFNLRIFSNTHTLSLCSNVKNGVTSVSWRRVSIVLWLVNTEDVENVFVVIVFGIVIAFVRLTSNELKCGRYSTTHTYTHFQSLNLNLNLNLISLTLSHCMCSVWCVVVCVIVHVVCVIEWKSPLISLSNSMNSILYTSHSPSLSLTLSTTNHEFSWLTLKRCNLSQGVYCASLLEWERERTRFNLRPRTTVENFTSLPPFLSLSLSLS
jgi:hypothetical protein